MTVGQIAEIKDKLVENDKKLADAVKDVNDKIENGELKGEKGDKGDKGDPGVVEISSNANNRATLDNDGKLFVPEITTDPLAWYILSKS